MNTVYCLSGLGADYRLFSKLEIPAIYEVKHLPWIANVPGETLLAYSQRMIDTYSIEAGQVIMGCSLGGIVGGIINEILPQKKVIIISSIAHCGQLPKMYRAPGLFPVAQRVLQNKKLGFLPILKAVMQPSTHEEKALLEDYAKTVSLSHILWVFREVLAWKNRKKAENLVQIHGTADRVFPFIANQADYVIRGGGHFMIMSQHREINNILKKILSP